MCGVKWILDIQVRRYKQLHIRLHHYRDQSTKHQFLMQYVIQPLSSLKLIIRTIKNNSQEQHNSDSNKIADDEYRYTPQVEYRIVCVVP